MILNELMDGQWVTARWGRAGPVSGDEVGWALCPWTEVELVVQRNDSGVVMVALKDVDFAEFCPDDFSNGTFYNEDYCLEIKGLEEG